jgi:hypothetical protein
MIDRAIRPMRGIFAGHADTLFHTHFLYDKWQGKIYAS